MTQRIFVSSTHLAGWAANWRRPDFFSTIQFSVSFYRILLAILITDGGIQKILPDPLRDIVPVSREKTQGHPSKYWVALSFFVARLKFVFALLLY